MKRAILSGVVVVGALTGFALSTPVGAAKADKVTICHYDGQGGVHAINISGNAVSAHFANHGDHGLNTYYADVDGDGYGAGAGVEACTAPTGYVDNADDCNDGDAAVNPAATEVCGDGVDNNCGGGADEGCVGCARILLHCNAGSAVLQTICGAGPHAITGSTRANISYLDLDASTSGAILTQCGTGATMTVTGDTNLCSLPGGCCGAGRWNDSVCMIQLF